MEELTPQEREALQQLSGESFDSGRLEAKITHTLRRKGLITRKSVIMQLPKMAWQIAAAVVLLLCGYLIGTRGSTAVDQTPNGDTYALFLYENDEFTVSDGNALVAEYTDWATKLGKAGKLAYAEKLDDNENWLGSKTVQNHTSKLTGYFVFYAKDLAEARQIAQTHPHTTYGGGLELRPIDKLE